MIKTFILRNAVMLCLVGSMIAQISFSRSAFAAPGAHGPNGEHLDGSSSTKNTGLARLADGSVNIPKLAQRRMSIRSMLGTAGEYPVTVELNGRVGVDPNASGRVQTPVAGRIEPGPNGLPLNGQRVTKGQVLVLVRPTSNPLERGNQQAQVADIQANRVLAAQRVKRLESLEGVVPQKEIEAARAELASLNGRERALSASLNTRETIVAPVSGVIALANALNGQIVESKDVLFEIIDPSRLIIEASSSNTSIASRISTASLVDLPNVQLEFLSAGRSLRDGALPLSFRARVKNDILAVGQPVTLIVKLTEKISGIVLPAEALVRGPSNQTIVWIRSGAERFIAQPVQSRPLDSKNVVVLSGLAPDNRVVVSGATLLNQIR